MILDKLMQSMIMLKLKFTTNLATFHIMNSSSEIVMLSPKDAIGILDIRSLGYFKIQQGILQQNLSKFYHFESVVNVCNQFNNSINTLKKEETIETEEKYPWLDNTDDRKYMSDREILEKYIYLSNSCLHEEKRRKLWICYSNIRKHSKR